MSRPLFLSRSHVRVIPHRDIADADRRSPVERIRRYEDEKRRWVDLHPEATSAEYQAAMTAIACRCGV
jgi:hypothetical protein